MEISSDSSPQVAVLACSVVAFLPESGHKGGTEEHHDTNVDRKNKTGIYKYDLLYCKRRVKGTEKKKKEKKRSLQSLCRFALFTLGARKTD